MSNSASDRLATLALSTAIVMALALPMRMRAIPTMA
jgi:hypothetical protein